MKITSSRIKRYFYFTFLAASLIFLAQSTASGWGALTGAQSHMYILREAYKKLSGDPAFKGSNFPSLDNILKHEGVFWVSNLFAGGFMSGPGPDSHGNSNFDWHYYNPRTKKGKAPKTTGEFYAVLKKHMEFSNRLYVDPTRGTAPAHNAAYLAHFVADMSVPYHINGMPASDALDKIKSGDGILDENIVGPTGKGPEDWMDELKKWADYYKTNKDADWFDPWYWDGWIIADKTSTHIKWEANYGPTFVTSAHTLKGYADGFWQQQQINGNGNPLNVINFTKRIAMYTNQNQKSWWGFFANKEVSNAYDHAITNVFTVWRASFSALRLDFSVKPDPQNQTNKLVVKIENVEDDEAATDIEIKVTLEGKGTLKGPSFHSIKGLPARGKLEIADVWEIEDTDKNTKVLIEATGKFINTPDSGHIFFENKIKILIPTSVEVIPSLVDKTEKLWKLEVKVKDDKGNPVSMGDVHFTADGGSFLTGSVVLEHQKTLSGGETIKGWKETDQDQHNINIKYLGDKADPAQEDEKYMESETSLTLPPEKLETSTVFVIDASGSMRGSKLAAAQAAVRAALSKYQSISDKEEWALYAFFDCGNCTLLQSFTCDPTQITKKLNFSAAGGTPIAYSLKVASNYLRKSSRGKKGRIILLSDGGESCSGNPVDAAESISTKKIYFDLKHN